MELNDLMPYVVTIVTGLGTAVTVLWKSEKSAIARQLKRQEQEIELARKAVENCEARHTKSDALLLDLTFRVGNLEGRREGVEQLAAELLAKMQSRVEDTAEVVECPARAHAGSG